MSRRSREVVVLLPATVTMGLMAGFFGDWAHTIMPGLQKMDDRTFVGAFQAFNQAIMDSAGFMIVFVGALVLTGVAAVLHLRAADRSPLPWVTVAFGFYLATVVITMAVHLPLNDGLMAAGDPDRIADLAAVRDAFQETRWVAWNTVRAVATLAAFGCLTWALVLHGRATADREALRPARTAPRPPPGATP
jgi:uncharacterized membrane protein